MLALVSKFGEELDVSRTNAIWRVIGFFFLSTCFVAIIAFFFALFPYTASFTEEVVLLPGNHIQVQQILDGEVVVEKAQFLEMAKGNTTFVALGERIITYMTKAEGVSYRYDQTVYLRPGYYVSFQEIREGMAVRGINRSVVIMIIVNIILPLLVLFFLSLLIFAIQIKKVSGWGSSAVFRSVWW